MEKLDVKSSDMCVSFYSQTTERVRNRGKSGIIFPVSKTAGRINEKKRKLTYFN